MKGKFILLNSDGQELKQTEKALAHPYLLMWNTKDLEKVYRFVLPDVPEYGVNEHYIRNFSDIITARPNRVVFSKRLAELIDVGGFTYSMIMSWLSGGTNNIVSDETGKIWYSFADGIYGGERIEDGK